MKIRYIIYFFAALLATASCGSDEPAPTPPTPTDGTRTVLVYMAANNSLGSRDCDAADIEEMLDGASCLSAGKRVLVFHSPRSGSQKLLEITAQGTKELKTYDDGRLAVEASRMREVLADVRTIAPASDYGLVLWSHGSGWLNDGIVGDGDLPQRSFGEEQGMSMNIGTLASILRDFGGVEYIYFDCCYMSSAETVYALRGVTGYIVGSATELPLRGMPYDKNLRYLVGGGEANLVAAATETFNFYNALAGSARTCTMSVVKTSALNSLATATAEIYTKSATALPDGYDPQRFMDVRAERCYYFDLYDYAKALCFTSSGAERFESSTASFNAFSSAFGNAVIYAAATPKIWNSVDLDRHHGLSTYIFMRPGASSSYRYSTLEWYENVASHIDNK